MIITTSQYKLDKSEPYGYVTAGLNLSPATEAMIVLKRPDIPTMCAKAGSCAEVCLNNTGMNVFPKNIVARANRTAMFIDNKQHFLATVAIEVMRANERAKKAGYKFAFRPNLLSDRADLGMELARLMPDVQFYDYTKLPKPWLRVKPNYHLTLSFSELMSHNDIIEAADKGVNTAVVFNRTRNQDLPEVVTVADHRMPVVDGDQHDLRFLDPKGVIIGLRFKGPKVGMAKAIADGFVMPVS